MFRKAQLKLFAIITSILLAVFIGLLVAVNVITEQAMNRQSEFVLKQIAASLEYDDLFHQFILSRPDVYDPGKFDIWKNEPPPRPTETDAEKGSTTTETTTETTTTETTSTTVTETEQPTEPEDIREEIIEEEQQEYNEPENNPEPPQQQQPAETDPPAQSQNPPEENHDSGNTQGGGNEHKQDWKNPWGDFQPPTSPNQGGNNNGQNGGMWTPWGWGYWPPVYPNYGWDSQFKEHDDDDDDDHDDKNYYKQSASDDFEGGIVALANTVTTDPSAKKTTSAETTTSKGKEDKPPVPPDDKKETPPDEHKNSEEKRIEPIPKTLGKVDFFAVMADKNGKFKATLNNDDLSDETAQSYISAIMEKDVDTAMLNSFQFFRTSKKNGTLIVFTDKSGELDVLKQLKKITIIIGIISTIILAAAAYFLSKKSIEPIKIAFDRQKQFVSDASHELKTPLTVISTNADVLEGEIGENKWLSYIKSQTERMSVLVNDLLSLTRLENNSSKFMVAEFDLSKAIENTALPFECQAFEQNKKFIIDVDKGIKITGSEQHLKQMAAIFIDNALKYSNDGGTVKVMLKRQGDKKIFSVYNTGQGVKDEDKNKIFERFYRSDESRNRSTGGYGLGLAIAKSIIDKHKFKINVLNQQGKSICFVVTM